MKCSASTGEVVTTGDDWRVEVLGSGVVPVRSEVTVHRTRQAPARLTCRAEADAVASVWLTSMAEPDT